VNVLLVEDNPLDARLIRGLLAQTSETEFAFHWVDRLSKALQHLATQSSDVVLLDLTLPDSDGWNSFDRVHGGFPRVPVVILTGRNDQVLAARAMQGGAQDYLRKDQVDAETLSRSLRYAIERKRAAEAIRQLNEELEQRVVERTRELAASNQALENFCHSIAHDLRTPLRAVDGFSAAVLEKCAAELSDECRGYMGRVREATRRMDRLIDALLGLTRVTRRPMRRELVDLSAMAREVARDLEPAESDRRVEFRIADELVAHGDPELLWLVLENLLKNAWKFSRQQPHPCVEFGREESGTEPAFFVRDNGVGFDMAYADKLFGTFERLHGVEFEGLGIGLATVYRILSRHGGRIWAESEVGRGSTFHFTLP
jgi:signal transduction histidine kinase